MPREYLRKYFIMGSQDCVRPPSDILQEAIDGGITAFQFREKGPLALKGEAKRALGRSLRAICQEHNVPFFINDDIELIEPLQVDGIHVGQDDTPVNEVRKKYPHLHIGLSISNREELVSSPLDLIDYIGAGPVFPTSSKSDAKQTVGLAWITYLNDLHPDIPIVGIGGIDTQKAADVIDAGADGVAVISAITKSTHIKQDVALL